MLPNDLFGWVFVLMVVLWGCEMVAVADAKRWPYLKGQKRWL